MPRCGLQPVVGHPCLLTDEGVLADVPTLVLGEAPLANANRQVTADAKRINNIRAHTSPRRGPGAKLVAEVVGVLLALELDHARGLHAAGPGLATVV
eukprot:5030098-Pyramimonas_sp.AAC.1